LKIPMLRAWQPFGGVSFRTLGENMFLIEFENGWERSKVMEGRPWVFDGNLVSLAYFDGLTFPICTGF
jgi:hypothetical protein